MATSGHRVLVVRWGVAGHVVCVQVIRDEVRREDWPEDRIRTTSRFRRVGEDVPAARPDDGIELFWRRQGALLSPDLVEETLHLGSIAPEPAAPVYGLLDALEGDEQVEVGLGRGRVEVRLDAGEPKTQQAWSGFADQFAHQLRTVSRTLDARSLHHLEAAT